MLKLDDKTSEQRFDEDMRELKEILDFHESDHSGLLICMDAGEIHSHTYNQSNTKEHPDSNIAVARNYITLAKHHKLKMLQV
jgi:hypothetical protein